ncbi:phage protein [Staphylococcus aureus]|nr:phage protein [Staphylococcus aureus]
MTQYLVTTFKDSTGQPHEHFTTARDNQTFTVVEAESKKKLSANTRHKLR